MNREQILAAVIGKNSEEIQQWLKSLEDNDFIEATEILEALAKELPIYKNDEQFRKEVDKIAVHKETFEDICNKEAVEQLKNEMALDESFKNLETEYNGLRETLITTVLENPNDEGLIRIARGMMQIEIDHNLHNPLDWEPISHLL